MATPAGIHVSFRIHTTPDQGASKAQGRPIFNEMEVVDIRFAGNSKTVATFPAHEAEPNATREAGETVTYAQLYNEQYRAFKSNEAQPVGGTPLSEAPFLTEAKRRELKALNIHTVETLAAVDGTPLKQLGMGGRELKNQAQAYLDAAAGTADVTGMAATIASLQQQLKDRDDLIKNYTKKQTATKYQKAVERSVAEAEANAQAEAEAGQADTSEDTSSQYVPEEGDAEEAARSIDDLTDQELKDFIKEETGESVRGNPSRETLITRATAILSKDEGGK